MINSQKSNFIKFQNFLSTTFNVKYFIIFVLHLFGALILAYVLALVLVYVGFLGQLSSNGIFVLWQKAGLYLLPTLIIFLSILVIVSTNPVYSLISLILVFFNTALFLLSIDVNFLAMIYLIIYIGAIAILFLFVIMMFNLRELKQQSTKINDYSFLSISFSFYLLILWKYYSLVLDYIISYIEYDKYFNDFTKIKLNSIEYYLTYMHADILLFGTLLYEYYSFLFMLAALILLTSMLGSIILALSTTEKTTDPKMLASYTLPLSNSL